MKQFTLSDIDNSSQFPRIWCVPDDLVEKPLWWHKQGIMQIKHGYGRKLTSSKMIHFNGRLRRIYHCIYGNSGSAYIIHNGQWLYID